MRELDPAPLTVPRETADRLVGNCRDHAVLLTALLCRQGVPARVRVGFARYFPSDRSEDHWISQYWGAEQGGWVLIDSQLCSIQREAFNMDFDPLNVHFYKHFTSGGQAWQLCRSGQCKLHNFGFKERKGWGYIRGSLLHAPDALNGMELLPTDWWRDLITKDEREETAEERALLDRLADLATSGT